MYTQSILVAITLITGITGLPAMPSTCPVSVRTDPALQWTPWWMVISKAVQPSIGALLAKPNWKLLLLCSASACVLQLHIVCVGQVLTCIACICIPWSTLG